MILIVGLGNPGKQYEKTRHNIGFDVIDYMANKYNIDVNREKFKGICGEGFIENKKVILLKPLTYMNLSGESIREFANFYKLEDDEIIVVYDDISLDIGRLRIREKGSAGGHNGIKSIIQNLGGDKFPRVKVGVGQPKDNLVNHVLGKFSKEDREHIEKVIPVVSDAIVEIVKNDAKESMNKFNGVNIE
ncbi:aminoacyl-tRNA hydrolase [Clostridium perfringens]|uniref:aminoacyl-tRNA hydrolase n=1 Tax=Clostridium perfringens TaxID=1502 RepID=UPI000E161B02|nr:aminoacyl-tRNA hydrolase [Clostridium perfringens]EJT5916714.1 aminoacyl-tRNA hydrolase [Clostridium perfringens]EJT6135813.1 aminoacyl-tRNA hydrolase [Clostridium perfringens]MDG6877066.1 Peptidyl-tRNA hydrolase [Clostridium perfringens]MDG6884021.1 Peptidyl-tRNA hydrolase [Clostridium perfringens]MDG6886826.1 Peptidyl-tRNA hydrolase [Clostridium perfringens]